MSLNNKGQMVVLDVLFAITLIVLSFLIVFKISEIEIYKSNSQRQTIQLNRIGEATFSTILNNTQDSCRVSDTHNNLILSGTIRSTGTNITKAKLSIPSDYNCYLSISGVNFNLNECNSIPPNGLNNIYAIDFNIGTCSTNATKMQYLEGIKGEGRSWLNIRQGTFMVWRGD